MGDNLTSEESYLITVFKRHRAKIYLKKKWDSKYVHTASITSTLNLEFYNSSSLMMHLEVGLDSQKVYYI